jgi:predicted HAD superfamily Cof-like phosphohydrolase
MKQELKKVADFHNTFGHYNGKEPVLLSKEEGLLRHNLMKEENDEYLQANNEGNLIEVADALGDKLYILCGTILRHGMQHVIKDVFDEIHRSNMSKAGPDGKPIYREDGKILKGENYFKPNLAKIIQKD